VYWRLAIFVRVKIMDREKIEYVKRRLVELVPLAEGEGADMLTYLIGVAIVETDDILSGLRPIEPRHIRPTHRD
jgi:hypothetical protein